MKSTAEHLGISLPGLYHYVKGRDELLRMAAELRLASEQLPTFTGQDWRAWLTEWGHYTRLSMSTHPELMQHFLTGGIDSARYVDAVDSLLTVLIHQGFSPLEAFHAWECISAIAVGTAASDIREHAATNAGQPWMARVRNELAHHDDDQLTGIRQLIAHGLVLDPDADFARRLDVALTGIAAMRSTTTEQ